MRSTGGLNCFLGHQQPSSVDPFYNMREHRWAQTAALFDGVRFGHVVSYDRGALCVVWFEVAPKALFLQEKPNPYRIKQSNGLGIQR